MWIIANFNEVGINLFRHEAGQVDHKNRIVLHILIEITLIPI